MTRIRTNAPFHILSTLRADGPHPELADQLRLFGQFIGVWDLRIKYFKPSGELIFDAPGEWSFSWVLDGRVIQDVLTMPSVRDPLKRKPGERGIGTTLRYYDPQLDLWRIVFVGAVSGVVVCFTARPVGKDIRIEGEDEDGLNRWMFTEIAPDSFHWKGFISNDQGTSWWLQQEMFGQRRAD